MRLISVLSSAMTGLLVGSVMAIAAPSGNIWNSVAVCDPNSPTHCVAPDSSGAVPVTPATGSQTDVNLKQVGGTTTAVGNGPTTAGTQRVTISNDSTGVVQAVGNVASGAADSGNPVKVGGIFNTTKPTLTDGQRGDVQMDNRGNVLVSLASGASPLAVTVPADNTAAGSSLQTTAFMSVYNTGTTQWDRVRGYSSALSAGGGVLASGVVAMFDDVSPAVPSEGNAPAVRQTANRALLVKTYASDAETWRYAAESGGITNTTGVTIKAAASGTLRNYVTACQFANSGAAGTDVQIRDGASGTVMWRGYLGASTIAGTVVDQHIEPPLRGTAATLTEVGLSSGTTVAVYVNCQGYSAS